MSLIGTWNIEVATPFFGTHPATLVFREQGGLVSGSINSQLGERPLESLAVAGDSFTSTVSLEVKGKMYDAKMTGQAAGDRIDGEIKVNMFLAPTVRYTGTRAG
ncbi:MAG TPA: hypothetical protein VEY09_02560 [Pyrinomonadaceae bacterium]|nr:hypothetical protein [Pyrinomonadaceae bacterium]